MMQNIKFSAIIRTEEYIDIRDLSLTQSEYDVLMKILRWLRTKRYGKLEAIRNDRTLDITISDRTRTENLTNLA